MTLTKAQRLDMLTQDTNGQFAYAVVMGGHSPREAARFSKWVVTEKRGAQEPADNLDAWYAR